jgi:hypothetical protein
VRLSVTQITGETEAFGEFADTTDLRDLIRMERFKWAQATSALRSTGIEGHLK